MTRVQSLLGLYKLALRAPEADSADPLRAWLAERQQLLDMLCADPVAAPTSVERALVALVLHADQSTSARFLQRKQRLAQQLRACRGLFSGNPLGGARSRGFFS